MVGMMFGHISGAMESIQLKKHIIISWGLPGVTPQTITIGLKALPRYKTIIK
jgi:hypothetical protein